jgi:hypothetical protein
MSHLKKDSFKVRIGDYVKKGTVVATCGNSGRSPVPHLHFQVQLTPEIGATTHPYPFGYFFEERDQKPLLRIGEIPKVGSVVYNVPVSSLASEALQAKPGRLLRVKQENETWIWRIATDAYNKTYIRCDKTGSTAYFENDGTLFYFTDFEGKKSSPLYFFYRSCFKLLLSNEKGIAIKDWVPLTKEHPAGTKWIQDFLSPFILFTRIRYESVLSEADNFHYPEKISYHMATKTSFLHFMYQRKEASVTITRKKIEINAQKRTLCIDWE